MLFKIKLWLYKKVEIIYSRLKREVQPELDRQARAVQPELDRQARAAAIAEGQRLYEALQEYKKKVAPRFDPKPKLTYKEQIKLRQDRCRHAKGGRWATTFRKDYAVGCFTFTDGSMRINCHVCSKEWWKTDKFTSPDWAAAVIMLENSTNTPNSAEQPEIGKRGPNGPNNLSQKLS